MKILLNATPYNLILSVSVIVKLLHAGIYPTECGRSVGTCRYVIWGGGGQKVPRSSPHPTHSFFFLIGPIARSVECLLHELTLPNFMFFLEQNPSSTDLRKSKIVTDERIHLQACGQLITHLVAPLSIRVCAGSIQGSTRCKLLSTG